MFSEFMDINRIWEIFRELRAKVSRIPAKD